MTAPYEDFNLTFEPSKLDPCENLLIIIVPPPLNSSLHYMDIHTFILLC